MKNISTLFLATSIIFGSINIAAMASFQLFTDEDQFLDWYGPSAKKMYSHNIMTGYEDGSFGGTNSVSRAELAVILDRYTSKIVGRELNEEPWACLTVEEPALNIYVQDQFGNPINEAIITTDQNSRTFQESQEGFYSGLEEAKKGGHYTFMVQKEGASSHVETIVLEHGDCGTIPQTKTITLFVEQAAS